MNFLRNLNKKPKKYQRMLGIHQKQFNILCANVGYVLKKRLCITEANTKKERKRAPGGGRKPKLTKIEDKLLVTLLYYKLYFSQEFIATIFDVDQSTISRTIRMISNVIEESADPYLEKYLEEAKNNCPKGKTHVSNIAEFCREYPDLEEIMTDGTEISCYRPQDNDKQKEHYSGKRKRHTLKIQLTVSSSKRVLDVSKTYPGSVHDKKIFDTEKTVDKTTRYSRHLVDKGYYGVDKENLDKNILVPFKKPKGGELSQFQKQVNRYNSGKRIVVENVIGKLKNNRIISSVFRGPIDSFNQIFRNIAAIWNFKLATTTT